MTNISEQKNRRGSNTWHLIPYAIIKQYMVSKTLFVKQIFDNKNKKHFQHHL